MKFFLLFLLIFLSSPISTHGAKYFPELQKVVDYYEHDPNCVFNYTLVDSKSIKNFPKCDMVFAILVINEKTDLTMDELKKGFGNIESLVGGLRIENTTFTSIPIFQVPSDGYFSFIVETYGVIVRNNTELTDAGWLQKINLGDDTKEHGIRVENNPKLDAKFLCDYGYLPTYTEVVTVGNLRDCACPGGVINPEAINQFKNCESIFNGVQLYNISDNVDLSGFSTVEFIRGTIDIQHTKLQNLSFFANLGDLKFKYFDDTPEVVLNLKNNSEMTRLGFPYLMEIQTGWTNGIKLANFENLHPDFCVTVQEMAFLLENRVSFVNFDAKICPESRTQIHNTKICNASSMSNLAKECNLIIGDLIINSGDEDHFYKLENVRYLFGSVAIQNTTLANLDMFNHLRYIVQLNDSHPVIQIVGNKKLESAGFWDMENIITRKNRNAVIQDNNKDMFQYDEEPCIIFGQMDEPSRKFRMDLTMSGGDCGRKVLIQYRYPSGAGKTDTAVLVALFLGFSAIIGCN